VLDDSIYQYVYTGNMQICDSNAGKTVFVTLIEDDSKYVLKLFSCVNLMYKQTFTTRVFRIYFYQ